jgi:hypothetical protein
MNANDFYFYPRFFYETIEMGKNEKFRQKRKEGIFKQIPKTNPKTEAEHPILGT